jgi:hypothetical protein
LVFGWFGRRGGSLLFLFIYMEIGFQLVEGFVLGIRTFAPKEEMPYSEVQIFIGFMCFYVIWD